MLKVIGGTVAIGSILTLFFSIALQTIGDLKIIKKETKKRMAIRICNQYQNVFERFILPDSFLLMKNRGENLCDFDEKILFINYGLDNLFM